ncbi:MAG: ATP-binding protein [Schleiferiaceae bacterium]|jgi:magnesium chelatase family protein|nr:ATP-binding protein [Schleiferiaceae bacterium]MDP4767535.1 ATP-binding protein [Schleiferiaceae bacterium]
MLVTLQSGLVQFLHATPITVEVSITRGIKYFIVGLADTALKESKQRIYTAIKNTQFHWPGQRITINLAPTTTRKFGTLLELPIALGVLAASGQFPTDRLEAYLIVGTLGLDGGVVPVEQPYQLLELAKRLGKKGVVLNTYSAQHTYLNERQHPALCVVRSLKEAVSFFQTGQLPAAANAALRPPQPQSAQWRQERAAFGCFSEVAGQRPLKRALEVAAAGGHHALIVGPPGVGKTMLCERLPSILPPITPCDQPWLNGIHSSGTSEENPLVFQNLRPFLKRSPPLTKRQLLGSLPDTAGQVVQQFRNALVPLDPPVAAPKVLGDVLATLGGVYCIDELHTTSARIRDMLLQPMNDHVHQLIGIMNPCHCGNFGHHDRKCRCTASSLSGFQGMLSGALLERFDMYLFVPSMSWQEEDATERSVVIYRRVQAAWLRQIQRQGKQNAQLSLDELEAYSMMTKRDWRAYYRMAARYNLSNRAQRNWLALSRTLADLDGLEAVTMQHIVAGLALMNPDRREYNQSFDAMRMPEVQRVQTRDTRA